MSPGLRSPTLRTAILPTAVSTAVYHSPDKSGLPSGVRGAGAVRFGLPSAVRGMPGVGYFNHCAFTGVVSADNTIARTTVFKFYLLLPASNGTTGALPFIINTPEAGILQSKNGLAGVRSVGFLSLNGGGGRGGFCRPVSKFTLARRAPHHRGFGARAVSGGVAWALFAVRSSTSRLNSASSRYT